MNKTEIEQLLSSLPLRYDREDYDRFIKAAKVRLSAPCINFVGSNGKSSTAIFLSSIYVENGYKVGLLKNLYVESSLACISINGESIAEEDFSRLYNDKKKLIEKNELSRWEIISAIAFAYFEEKKVDLAILESSLGGALDASYLEDNDQRLVILTSLTLEHTQYLGTTLSQIALSKISLLGEDSKLLIPELSEENTKLLRDYAEEVGSEFYVVDAFHFEKFVDGFYQFHYRPYAEARIKSPAKYLIKDASLALEATKLLSVDFPISEEKVLKALANVFIPLTLEKKGNDIFDMASNPEAAEDLVGSFSTVMDKPVHFLFASKREANIASILPFLSNYCESAIITSCPLPNMRHEEGYFFYVEDYEYIDDPMEAYAKMREAHPEDYILITGSSDFVRYMKGKLS